MIIQTSGLIKWAAIALFAGSALAQGAQHGTFHLPFQARWGETVLEPGDYSLTLPEPSIGNSQVRVIAAEGKTAYEMPLYTQTMLYSDSNKLILTNINGQHVVTDLSLGTLGKEWAFPVSKSIRNLTSARSSDKLALAIH
jgi:hypothetical protein